MPTASWTPLVICDEQYEASAAFGGRGRELGAQVHAIRSDITQLWRTKLIPLWRSGCSTQIGMTGHDALFCLDMVARDWGMRAVYRMHHRPLADGAIVHERIGYGISRSLESLQSPNWARRNADLLLDRSRRPFDVSDATACQRDAVASSGICRDSLVSWILAPIAPPTLTASQILKNAL